MNRQVLKQKLHKLLGFRINKMIAAEADVQPHTVAKWFCNENYVNGDIEAACLTLIDNAQRTREELKQFISK